MGNKSCYMAAIFMQHDLVKPLLQMQLTKHSTSIQVMHQILNRWDGMTFSDDCFIGSAHVNAQTNVSIRLRNDQEK